MMNKILLLSLVSLFISCNSNKSQEGNKQNNIIDITEAVNSREKIILSEIVDNISFLILGHLKK